MRRALAGVLAGLLGVATLGAVGIGTSWFGLYQPTDQVTGVIGSEKAPFFADQRTVDRFEQLGLEVDVDTAGSRQIATEALAEQSYDFAFPSSEPAARKVEADQDEVGTEEPFYSPMAIATFQPVFDLLVANGLAREEAGVRVFDVAAYLQAVSQGRRWQDLAGNEQGQVYRSQRQLLVTTTDVRSSNSAGMWLAITSYVSNGGSIVGDAQQADAAADAVETVFLGQGLTEESSAGPFENYLSRGIQYSPLVLAYESQFLEQQIRQAQGQPAQLTDDMILMYPSPTVFSQHVAVALDENGQRVAEALTTDPQLQDLLAEYGFRTPNRATFTARLEGLGVEPPPDITDTADTPTYELLERMIARLEEKYTAAGLPPAQDDAAAASGEPTIF